MISPLAIPATRMFTGRSARRTPIYGVTIHTTGSGLPIHDSKRALERAVEIYTGSGGPHYVIGHDGTIVATVADERIRGAHAGVDAATQASYRSGNWTTPNKALWQKRWPGARSPVDLIPNRDLNYINDLWIGIEHIPITADGRTYYAQPAYPGSRFTAAQYEASRRLVDDIGKRHGLPSGWKSKSSTRLIDHSSLNPIHRDSPNVPLWDPGVYTGAFDDGRLRSVNWTWLLLGGAAAVAGIYAARWI